MADRLLDRLQEEIAEPGSEAGCLGTLVADDAALSHRQAELKHRACERVGMRWRSVRLGGNASTEMVLSAVAELNDDADGIFVHWPLPPQVDADRVLDALPPAKDIDGLRPVSPFVAASAVATLDVLRAHDVRLDASRVVVVGGASSLVCGLERVLGVVAAALTTVPPGAEDAAARCRAADVVVGAAYRRGLVNGDWVSEGAAVVDAASGDVDVDSLCRRTGLLCASPGGIGPPTVARLLSATHAAASGR
ncbi:MAG: tetrahydrofolate dehydrogenase/cyclohydrolase catalytic domain-containing protein [Nocardioidaceae bacterium]